VTTLKSTEINLQQIISFIEGNLYDYWFALRNNKGCQYIDQPNEKWISLSYTNRVLYTSFSTDVELNLFIEKLKKTKRDWIYIIGPSSRPCHQIEIIKRTEGFYHLRDWAGMALELSKLKRGEIDNLLHIEKIDNLKDFETWVDVYAEGFNIDPSLKQGIFENFGQHLVNENSPVHFYLGFYNGCPAATTAIHYKDSIVGIYKVATRPGLRRKGIASSILQNILEESMVKGYKWAVLHATEEGYYAYKKLGFETYCQFHVYLLKGL
jgi:GNAT superfamily N-acetyltransferase